MCITMRFVIVCSICVLLQFNFIVSFQHHHYHRKVCNVLNCADKQNDIIPNKDNYLFTTDDDIISDSKSNGIDIKTIHRI